MRSLNVLAVQDLAVLIFFHYGLLYYQYSFTAYLILISTVKNNYFLRKMKTKILMQILLDLKNLCVRETEQKEDEKNRTSEISKYTLIS